MCGGDLYKLFGQCWCSTAIDKVPLRLRLSRIDCRQSGQVPFTMNVQLPFLNKRVLRVATLKINYNFFHYGRTIEPLNHLLTSCIKLWILEPKNAFLST